MFPLHVPGAQIGILGLNASGKSTLLDIILSLRTPSQGSVLWRGVDLRSLPLSGIRKECVLVRGVEIFEGTLLENLTLGRQECTLDQVQEVLDSLGILEMVLKLPDGLNTHLSGGQSPFSNGELRALMIARSLLQKPALLLLDEPFEGMDPTLFRRIQELLRSHRPEMILLVASTQVEDLSFCSAHIRWCVESFLK